MTKRSSSVLFTLWIALLFAFTSPAQAAVFNAKSATLENGLQMVVVENNRAPVITHMVWYRVGSADEMRGKSGIAHFLEHLMFKGSKQIGGPDLVPGEFSRIIRTLGGNDNAFTSNDYTAYYQSVPAEHLERVMRMEAGRMRGLMLPEKEVESERLVILEERRQRTDNDPAARLYETLGAALFPNHPYGIPIIGWYHEMEGLNWDDATSFYKQYYAPNNAILVVSGDVKADDVFAKAAAIYGDLAPSDTLPPRNWTKSPPLAGQNVITYRHASVRQPQVVRLYRAPSASQNETDSLALEVMAEIASGGPSSRLYQELVVKQKLATAASVSYDATSLGDGTISLGGTPAEGVTPETLEAALATEILRLAAEPVTEAELKEAIQRMQDAAVFARDSLTGPAMTIAEPIARLDRVRHRFGKVTALDDVTVALPSGCMVGLIGP
ncbi:MAG TPA: pitrilysin family protein, partial [Alphaproteobacteria bacterium]|nr:pitrilysin family protein [Alphaproteobacteria bacterium]